MIYLDVSKKPGDPAAVVTDSDILAENARLKEKVASLLHGKANFMERVLSHYEHARKKHSHFCDSLFSPRRLNCDGGPDSHLKLSRKMLRTRIRQRDCDFIDLADCEMAEMYSAYMRGDFGDAVDECFDIIAVLLRAIDFLEGRQKLGNSASKTSKKGEP